MTVLRSDRSVAGDHRESGFTLIEVVITVVLLTMITGAISAAFVTTLELSSKTAKRSNESNDTELIAFFLTRDAQAVGATDPVTGAANADYGVTAGSAAGCAIPDGSSPVARFKWLERSSAASTGKQDDIAVYYYVPPVGTQPGRVVREACLGTAAPSTAILARNIAPTPSVACVPTCTGLPDAVSLTFKELQTTQPYTITASTRPEGQPAATNADTTSAPLVLIGNGACSGTSPLSGSGNLPLKVYGTAFIEGGGSGCDAANVDSYTVTGTNEAIAPAQCGGLASCTNIGGITARDPFAGKLTPPSASGTSQSGCSGPGFYGGGLTITAGTTCTLDPGVYVVQNGIHVPAGAAINTDRGGVLIYLESGQFTIDDNAKFTASPIAGQFDGIVLWQAAGDTATLTAAAGSNVHLNGTVYAPGAAFHAAKRVAMKGLVAQGLSFDAASAITADDRSQIGLITPTVTSMTPNLIDQVVNPTHETITIVGTNFKDTPTVSFSDPGIHVDQVNFVSSTRITVDITVQPAAKAGTGTVFIKNPDEGIDVEADQFTVQARPDISSVTLTNAPGNTAGQIDTGDKITVVFSRQMRVRSFCAAWVNDGANQNLVVPGDVIVTVSDGTASANTISVDSLAGCGAGQTFHFGTIDLGSPAYVTGAPETFGNDPITTTPTTIVWTASSHTLVITLGNKAGTGVVAPVAQSIPTYTADPGITDTFGGPVGNSPLVFPNSAQQF